ncbi:hypothetical protein Ait01nite_053720 [Actinoplanes italicus]|uniref:Uncharacterized protein n=1 Tax=Actinoplanes italicus TaxID=113567 RepID=A0A2T0K7U6_9ACTN|nr:hypothetical protein [Actinoplanes italicus]PRX19096.1 hypothetical protein CLV67_111244 [Actinoplanes italicus]GIE32327.1 hypothetical protein Ait01nite_053720 [Actinoplanes italicus]
MATQISVIETFSTLFAGEPREDAVAPAETVPQSRKDEYLNDLADVHGLDRPVALSAMTSRSYGEMAATALEGCGAGSEHIDVIVLAYANTEFFVPKGASSFLSEEFPSAKLVYAVTDQGKLAPFTALKLAHCHLHEEECERAAVVAIEQRAVPLVGDHVSGKPEVDAAAAILLSRDVCATGVEKPSVALRKVGGQAELGPLVREMLRIGTAELDGDPLIVIGERIPGGEAASFSSRIHRAEAGRVCTGVWETLDRSLRGDGGYSGPVLVMEYDPILDQLGVASMIVP